jgi:hypothetical protein
MLQHNTDRTDRALQVIPINSVRFVMLKHDLRSSMLVGSC